MQSNLWSPNMSELATFIDPEGVVIKIIALQEIGTPSVRPSVRGE